MLRGMAAVLLLVDVLMFRLVVGETRSLKVMAGRSTRAEQLPRQMAGFKGLNQRAESVEASRTKGHLTIVVRLHNGDLGQGDLVQQIAVWNRAWADLSSTPFHLIGICDDAPCEHAALSQALFPVVSFVATNSARVLSEYEKQGSCIVLTAAGEIIPVGMSNNASALVKSLDAIARDSSKASKLQASPR